MTTLSMRTPSGIGMRRNAAAAAPAAAAAAAPTAKRNSIAPRPVARGSSIIAWARFVLTPTGDGSVGHLDASEAEALSRAFPPSGAVPPIPLPEGLHELGREQPAELVLPVPTVSARHARLSVGANSVSVADLGSTNGTYLDGAPLEPMAEVAVGVGQEVVFGDQYLAKYRLDAVEEVEEV